MGEIDPEKSGYTIGKVKVEVRLEKTLKRRWGRLVGEASECECCFRHCATLLIQQFELTPAPPIVTPFPTTTTSTAAVGAGTKPFYKNWDGITNKILGDEKNLTSSDDPNAGGDAAVNKFFQEIYGNADENTKRAMMKSFVESGGTTLSTNWDEVGKGHVDVKPPQGSEWKKWGV